MGAVRLRKKSIEVDVVRWDGKNLEEVNAFILAHTPSDVRSEAKVDAMGDLWIYVYKSLQTCHVEIDGWIIAEPDGQGVYPCTAADREAGFDIVG